ncbi:thiamine pyrophosphate-dependent enzyme [Alkalitalea saponilacus]|uniref:2-oxoglutarate ferredoxin oxidoreductase subunit beta n=1 Tax=Alkalitalea saponilacus TaxID=889453 RepID=A0A1T5GAZ4_9BACT|nr:thiamine pyrophosphate-dependent enzyme [Alkalitalea saponilacus]ASB47912.1 2-oxoglutarate oxidoreductase [Alkalitalea saponilacus]SKC05467.1 2-oxoglutarate ferredoxin oxidoreductase subunit beta [Alkalitalea saponilacus]
MALEVKDIIKPENLVYAKTKLLTERMLHYCPGCTHGVVNKLIAEVIDELNIQEDTIGVTPVGCSVLLYNYIEIDWHEAAHGRAPAVGTGIKRLRPEKYVFTYQGDGDLAAIGTAETIHACNRGENMLMVFINNGIYGMTGGQMAPTTLEGMKASTCPFGRDVEHDGNPLNMTSIVATLPGTCYVTRQAAHTAPAVRKLKKALRKAFENQKDKKGTSFIEVVATCSSGWKMNPVQSNKWMEANMFPIYPLGDIKDV